jgi:hypothetical protein
VVGKGPDWFENVKSANRNFTFLEVPSREFITELYGKAYSFRGEVEKRLVPGKESTDKRISPAKGADDLVDGGAFGGLSNEPDNAKP